MDSSPWHLNGIMPDHLKLPAALDVRYGTISALVEPKTDCIQLIAVTNRLPGNGHFGRFLQTMQLIATLSGLPLRMVECMNFRLVDHLKAKGWIEVDGPGFTLQSP